MNLNLDIVPTNLDSAVNLIIEALTPEEKQVFLNPVGLHHGFGTWLRNIWSLWDKETLLVQWFVENLGIIHADDISATILTSVSFKVRQEEFNVNKHVEIYKNHWRRYGLNPATMEKYGT